eukprot:Opistho-2@67139
MAWLSIRHRHLTYTECCYFIRRFHVLHWHHQKFVLQPEDFCREVGSAGPFPFSAKENPSQDLFGTITFMAMNPYFASHPGESGSSTPVKIAKTLAVVTLLGIAGYVAFRVYRAK